MDNLLKDHPYLCGDTFSNADIVAYSYCRIQEKTSLDLTPYENIMRWYGEISERPAAMKVNEIVALPF